MCLDLRLIALKMYWSKGQGCVRITAKGIKFVEGNKDFSSTGTFQLNGGRWMLLTSVKRQRSQYVVWVNDLMANKGCTDAPGCKRKVPFEKAWILCKYHSKKSEAFPCCTRILPWLQS